MNKKDIMTLFPEVKKIRNKSIREGVIATWLLAVRRGKWKNIKDIPFTLLIPTKKKLIEHTRCVTQMAIAIAKQRQNIDSDMLIAGGLVHDVGKLLEYERRGKKFVKSRFGKKIRHPVSGYALALEAGLPLAVAHIVAVHSTEGEKMTRSSEAVIIHHCDFIDFDTAKLS